MGRKLAFFKTNHPYIISVFFLTITLIKLILLCVFYNEAAHGMSTRLQSIVNAGESNITWGLIVFSAIFALWLVFLCLADLIAMATLNGVDLSKFGFIPRIACIGSYCSVTVFSVLLRLQTILWAIVLTAIGVESILGVIFIDATDVLCKNSGYNTTAITPTSTNSGENMQNSSGCIDLTALRKVVQILTFGKPANLTVCDSHRDALCSKIDGGLTTAFLHCYLVGVLVLIGLLHFLINMVANKNRYLQMHHMGNLSRPDEEINEKPIAINDGKEKWAETTK